MSKNKSKTVISEEEKAENPIFKAIYNRIRNINKKIQAIQALETNDVKHLKNQQKQKLERKTQFIEQIKKHEEFALYYKHLLVENNLSYDKTEDLIKLSTLIAVGKEIEKEQYCPKQTQKVYQNIYSQVFLKSCLDGKKMVSDEISRIFLILSEYLSDYSFYSECRDYMTYLPQIKENQRKTLRRTTLQRQLKLYEAQSPEMKDIYICIQPFKIQLNDIISEVELSLVHKENNSSTKSTEATAQFENKESGTTQNQLSVMQQCVLQNDLKQGQVQNGQRRSKKRNKKKKAHKGSSYEQNKNFNRGNKNYDQWEQVVNVRKMTDTSLEPTPEKYRAKKIKYVEKLDL